MPLELPAERGREKGRRRRQRSGRDGMAADACQGWVLGIYLPAGTGVRARLKRGGPWTDLAIYHPLPKRLAFLHGELPEDITRVAIATFTLVSL